LTGVLLLGTILTAQSIDGGDETPVYYVANVFDVGTRSQITATGAAILEVGHDYVLVEATPHEARQIARLGLSIDRPTPDQAVTLAFPSADSAYHDYAEMVAEIQQAASDHPAIFSLFSLGSS